MLSIMVFIDQNNQIWYANIKGFYTCLLYLFLVGKQNYGMSSKRIYQV